MRITATFKSFLKSEQSSGILLIACTLLSLTLSNFFLKSNYIHIWEYQFASHSLEYWINDGLMTLFFLQIGLELKRELYIGELSQVKKALLPVFAAFGGMIIPACIYLFFNFGTTTQNGFGIPMATDIAFALALLSLLGKNVPIALKVFLTALAVIDDLGAIIIIAVFYTQHIVWMNLFLAFIVFVFLLFLKKRGIQHLAIYLVGGIIMWYFMLNSGVHATITGILLAFTIPFGKGRKESSFSKLLHLLEKPVSYLIVPLFALANTAIAIQSDWKTSLFEKYAIGIFYGLLIGKPIGITLFSYIAVQLKIVKLPVGIHWKMIFGAGILGGIGFTMSIFITLLAFTDQNSVSTSKIIIMISSLTAGIIGYLYLKSLLKKATT